MTSSCTRCSCILHCGTKALVCVASCSVPCWLQVVSVLQKLPMDTVMTRAGLEQLTPHELKQRLSQQHISCTGCVEKQELVEKLLEAGGSSGASCSICCEDYAGGDVARVLPCKHRYHVECIDRWAHSAGRVEAAGLAWRQQQQP